MRTVGAALTGRWARSALLAATLFGLAMMHSLGHGGGPHPVAMAAGPHPTTTAAGPHGAGTGEPHPTTMAADPHRAVVVGPGAADRPGGDPQLALPADGGGGGHPAGWSVCAAVLGGLAAVALLAVLLLTVGVGLWNAPAARNLSTGSRAPPKAGPIGLTLARVSVRRR
ncbi:hypothetical protein [Micromonospora echinofusca]|uniref:Uncharacterized protein n=1 Tax=Micromonospora echinofusca TaxID=47858 RepID=A0ABS3VVB0_MICEH|nr:hypothetical protein [Micromonospora echinofusca]MBO4208482.1 hypothetical protein [Micromonospora echinofusca]